MVEVEARARSSGGVDCDSQLKNSIEGIIIKWAYQVDEVLSKDSAESLADDKTPGPMTELNFWAAQCINLESLFEQMQSQTTIKMASILFLTDSAYYPAFKAMYRNVVSAMKEAQDITTHLKPLESHFEALEVVEWGDVRTLFPPLMHVICLVYSNRSHNLTLEAFPI